MKKLIIACALTTSIATLSYAQDAQKKTAPAPAPAQNRPTPPSAEDRAKHHADMLKGRLGLSDEQYKSVYDAVMQSEKSRDEMMKSGKMNNQTFQKLHEDEDAKIRKTLTAEQAKKYDEMMPKRPPHPAPGAPGAPAPAPAPQQK